MSISEYSDDLASGKEIAIGIAKLNAVFPRMQPEFWNVLAERIVSVGFTSKRLKNAIENVIDNFQYKELNISDIIKYDRRVKLYTGKEFCEAQLNGTPANEFEKMKIDGVNYFAKKVDLLNK